MHKTSEQKMKSVTFTDRQVTILTIALTTLYDEIAKTKEGQKMKEDIMELSELIMK